MKREFEEDSATEGAELPVGWFWPVLGLGAFLSLPYYFSLDTFFSHDDFAILYFHKDWPVWKPWLFLQTDVLTFYRPFQSYAMALLFHFYGMNPFPYSSVLVAIHVIVVVLFGRLVERLFDDRPLTFLSVIFYAANWEYCDVVFWKGNYGTALSWLFALGAANAFVDYLRGEGWRRYVASLGLTAAALLAKETAANLPLLLSLIYWMRPPQPAESRSATPDASPPHAKSTELNGSKRWAVRLLGFSRILWPFYALIAAYLIFHHLAVRDVYSWLPKGYEVQGPLGAVTAVFHALTFWLTPFLDAIASLFHSTPIRPLLLVWLLPITLIAATVRLRNRRLAWGMLWAVLAFFPANMIPDYHTPRYYYGAIMGIAIVFAEIFLAADRAIVARQRFAETAVARLVGSLLILAFVYSNMIYTTAIVGQDARKCREIQDLYHFLVLQRAKVPPKTLFRVWCLNQQDHFHQGFGLREMFKLALDDRSVEAILPDENLTEEVRNLLLNDYSKPVEVFREATGRFRVATAVPPTSTATLPPNK